MFKKRCTKCEMKFNKSFDFCPYCGFQSNEKEDYGLLGKNDDIANLGNSFGNLGMPNKKLGNFTGSFMEKMLGSAFKMLEKEMRNLEREEGNIQNIPNIQDNHPMKTNFQLYINGKRVNIPEFTQRLGRNMPQQKKEIRKEKLPEISDETLKKASKLPRKEAKTKLTRFKDKLVYELNTPGLDSVNNVLINKLESSIEIKAYTDKAVFFKNLPIKFPLMKYSINPEEGKLFLEFKA